MPKTKTTKAKKPKKSTGSSTNSKIQPTTTATTSATNKTSSTIISTTTATRVVLPSDEELKQNIVRLLPLVNLEKTGVKAFIRLLSKECNDVNLKSKTKYIKATLEQVINEMDDSEEEDVADEQEEDDNDDEDRGDEKQAEDDDDDDDDENKESLEDEDDSDEDDEEDDDDEEPRRRNRHGTAAGSGRGLSVKKELSPALADFLGQGTKEMARTDVVKHLWNYIKEHDLQNPDNKREILLDERMKQVFHVDKFTMFTMNKYVAEHIYPFKPVDFSPKEKKLSKTGSKRKRKSSVTTPGRNKKGGSAAFATSLAASDDSPTKKKRKPKKPGLQPPYRLSSELAAVVGKDILPRPQVVAAIWEYIKSKELQNPTDKREIICDDKLQAIMGGNDRVTMFNMNRFITEHLVEKLDRSYYNHEEEEGKQQRQQQTTNEEYEEEDDDDGGESV